MTVDGKNADPRRRTTPSPAPRPLDLAMLVVMTFCAFECLLLAAAFRGTWLALAVPGLVCAGRAWTIWKEAARAPAPSHLVHATRVAHTSRRSR